MAEVERFLRRLADAGFSASTVDQTRSVLRSSIRRAQRDSRATRNVADLAKLPAGMHTRKSKSLTLAQVTALLEQDKVKHSPWWTAYFTVSVMTGLRLGELLGLRWEDVDFGAGVIRVRYSLKEVRINGRQCRVLADLKTEQSKRTVKMPAEVRRVLQALRKQQAADKLARGPGYGCALENCGPAGLVFSNRHGRPANDDAVRRSFKLRCDWAGIGTDWQPREGRHTFASVLSDSGQDIEHISDAMGHANSIITRRVYRHQISDMINEVALVMDQVFPPGSVGGQDGG